MSSRVDELNSVLALVAYKWLVPCFVNQLPMRTLLMCWDQLLLRPPAAPHTATRLGHALSGAHLHLALSLLSLSSKELVEVMTASHEEAVGIGFGIVLRDALSATNVGFLLQEAKRFELSPEQLAFLRRQSRPREADSAVGAARGLSTRQLMTFRLLSHRAPFICRLVKEMLLIRPPQPPPMRALENLPMHYSRLVSICGVTFMSTLLLTAHSLAFFGRGQRPCILPGIARKTR
uniref:Rab-GAP TBC domain-containing protein n=2 Tax=Chrysotila carterae TaxID=13221 RepID=A0A7S4B2Q4_CHRCT